MIVDFTIKNFRSLRDEQTLSFYAERSPTHLAGNIQHPSQDIGVLATAAIYGANASGKSNILTALKAFFWLVSESHSFKENAQIPPYEPYRLSGEKKRAPVEFALEFVVDGTRYLYEIIFNQELIVSEKLSFYSVSPTRTVLAKLFERAEGASWEDITFGSHYKGGTRRIPLFDNQAYLSKAGNTPDAPEQIRRVYQFFTIGIQFMRHDQVPLDPTWKKKPDYINKVSNFLNAVDTGITKLVIKHEDPRDFHKRLPADLPEHVKSTILDDVSHAAYFEHAAEDGTQEVFSESDESDGTRALLSTLPFIFNVLQTGKVLVWDELETSLHPHVAELIVELFNDPEINIKHAQLLFTTHNLALMNSEKLRKDQFWLTEKVAGATHLISMDEFESSQLKNNSPFAKWYYDGRLGGLPAINYSKVKELFSTLTQESAEDGKKT